MDVYDIGNKALLCDPSFDTRCLSMFKNPRYNRLRIVSDLECASQPGPSVRAKRINVRVERVDHHSSRAQYPDHQEQYDQRRCVTSMLPSASPTPSPSTSPQMDISPVPSMSTMPSWSPRNSNFNETHSNPVRIEIPVNPAVTQNVAVNPVMTSTPTTSAMPPLAPYPLNVDRFDLNVHFLLTYLCLMFLVILNLHLWS